MKFRKKTNQTNPVHFVVPVLLFHSICREKKTEYYGYSIFLQSFNQVLGFLFYIDLNGKLTKDIEFDLNGYLKQFQKKKNENKRQNKNNKSSKEFSFCTNTTFFRNWNSSRHFLIFKLAKHQLDQSDVQSKLPNFNSIRLNFIFFAATW